MLSLPQVLTLVSVTTASGIGLWATKAQVPADPVVHTIQNTVPSALGYDGEPKAPALDPDTIRWIELIEETVPTQGPAKPTGPKQRELKPAGGVQMFGQTQNPNDPVSVDARQRFHDIYAEAVMSAPTVRSSRTRPPHRTVTNRTSNRPVANRRSYNGRTLYSTSGNGRGRGLFTQSRFFQDRALRDRDRPTIRNQRLNQSRILVQDRARRDFRRAQTNPIFERSRSFERFGSAWPRNSQNRANRGRRVSNSRIR